MIFRRPSRLSLEARLFAVAALAVVTTALVGLGLSAFLDSPWLTFLISLPLGLSLAFVLVLTLTRALRRGLDAIDEGMLNLTDNDFSVTLAPSHLSELNRIIEHYNQLANSLRRERQTLHQRELLLDTVMENSLMSVLIADQNRRVIYANRVAEQLLRRGEPITGLRLPELLEQSPVLLEAIEREQSGIFRLQDQSERLHHLSCGHFVLNAQHHTLILIKEMTREMNRQEAATWKKVIRVISHELNNSLAPISSLAHSGQLMLEQGQESELPEVFAILAERAEHLKNFVGRYARIAKLPHPRKTEVDWHRFHQSLTRGSPFTLEGALPETPGYFDVGQMHQVLINLLKNAHESGSPPEQIQLGIVQTEAACIIEVTDRGPGMSPETLHSALLPFYSTKPSGSGVGLSLCREIVEAHEGQLALANREGGGLRVTITLPRADS